MRADKAKTLAKVTKVILENPLDTEREIARKAGISNTTAHFYKKSIEQTQAKDDRIVGLTDGDFEVMKKIQQEKFERLKNPHEVNDADLDRWENTATKRYSLFRGSATDEQGGLKAIDNIEIL